MISTTSPVAEGVAQVTPAAAVPPSPAGPGHRVPAPNTSERSTPGPERDPILPDILSPLSYSYSTYSTCSTYSTYSSYSSYSTYSFDL